MSFNKKDLISVKDLSASDINYFIETAKEFKKISLKDIKKVPTLRGKTVVNIFYEPSTRTRSSFEIAQKRLSADSLSISIAQSSVTKGESLKDTILNLEAMKPDAFVLRHSESGAAHFVSKWTEASVINAGDGINEHPTQCLLDIMTVMEEKKDVGSLKVAIIGDIYHSRVARSDIYGFSKLGAEVYLYAPHSLLPRLIELKNVKIAKNMEEAVKGADVIIMLRIQKERASYYFIPSIEEYRNFFQLTPELLSKASKRVMVLHPGPVNRDVEIAGSIINGGGTHIFKQVENGVAVRMACLYILLGYLKNK
ncbi:MAG: aspartate carbamoyltransferase catalytic subunit [Deltaproteobacteria bacterium]|jgi:aspartate carbamoyltransferase catalytic subunit|nr:aspartate carbamoyltransferase catalytic subunit [Deltaproteobacteria bacterium]